MTSLQTASLEEIRVSAASICGQYLGSDWRTVPIDQLIVKRVSGGLSNFLYYVSLPKINSSKSKENIGCVTDAIYGSVHEEANSIGNKSQSESPDNEKTNNAIKCHTSNPQEVLLRIYGQSHGENALEAMITESVIFALLSERNFGPKLYGLFPGGRIEQFIPARPLVTTELSNDQISIKISHKMAEIHGLNIPMSKEPDWIWNCMERWTRIISKVLSNHTCQSDPLNEQIVRSFNFPVEAMWLKTLINSKDFRVLFCHNDLQEGNILLREDTASVLDNNNFLDPELVIIDFEYCAYNYRGFDLANHFLEWTFNYCNPNFPYFFHHKHLYPNQQQRERFIIAYLQKLNEYEANYSPSREEVEAVNEEVEYFTLLSHLFWSLWSVVNVGSNIEFGYWEYAVARITEFKLLKERFSDHI